MSVFNTTPSDFVDQNTQFSVLNDKTGLTSNQFKTLVENTNYLKNHLGLANIQVKSVTTEFPSPGTFSDVIINHTEETVNGLVYDNLAFTFKIPTPKIITTITNNVSSTITQPSIDLDTEQIIENNIVKGYTFNFTANLPNSIIVDDDLSTTSTNAVENKVVTSYINSILNNSSDLSNSNGGFRAGAGSSSISGGAIGLMANTSNGGAVGEWATSGSGFAGGSNAKTVDTSNTPIDAIQLGTGTNSTQKTLQIYDDNIYNADTHTLTAQNITLNGTDLQTTLDNMSSGSGSIIASTDLSDSNTLFRKTDYTNASTPSYMYHLAPVPVYVGDIDNIQLVYSRMYWDSDTLQSHGTADYINLLKINTANLKMTYDELSTPILDLSDELLAKINGTS